jgi:transposase
VDRRFRVCHWISSFFFRPPYKEDWLPENHLARLIADVTNELDLSAIYAQYGRRDGGGLSAYHLCC